MHIDLDAPLFFNRDDLLIHRNGASCFFVGGKLTVSKTIISMNVLDNQYGRSFSVRNDNINKFIDILCDINKIESPYNVKYNNLLVKTNPMHTKEVDINNEEINPERYFKTTLTIYIHPYYRNDKISICLYANRVMSHDIFSERTIKEILFLKSVEREVLNDIVLFNEEKEVLNDIVLSNEEKEHPQHEKHDITYFFKKNKL